MAARNRESFCLTGCRCLINRHTELGEQGLTPASSQVTYLLLLTSFLLVSLSYYYTEYKNDYPFHSITFFMPWRLRL